MSKIIIFQSDNEYAEYISFYLSQEQCRIWKPYEEDEVLRLIDEEEIELLIMDLRDGKRSIDFLATIRKRFLLPILVLSDLKEEEWKLMAFGQGADDYITKSCSILELMARIKVQLRRYFILSRTRQNIDCTYQIDELLIDDKNKHVSVSGQEVRLTPIEYKILKLLVEERGKVLSIEQIYERIWKMRAIGADNTVAVHIRHIREKIEPNPKQPRYLKVVWGAGYRVG